MLNLRQVQADLCITICSTCNRRGLATFCSVFDMIHHHWADEEVGRVKVNFTFENFEGQDEVSSEASAYQREEVELAKPFLIWHVTKTSH